MARIRLNLIKSAVYRVIEVSPDNKAIGKLFDLFMIVLICLNILAFAFETVDEISIPYKSYFVDFETLSVVIFTIEYLLRLWTCTLEPAFRHPIRGRLQFVVTPLSLIDFISILPYYLFMLFPSTVFIHELHLLRLARLLKIGRYSKAMRTLGRVIEAKRESLFSALFTVFSLLMVASSLIYYVEHAAQPDRFPNIPASMWWAVITLTTVGYGDVYPVTPLGKILAGCIAVMGLGLVALPAGIVASGFTEEVEKKRSKQTIICPHCGEEIEHSRRA